MGFIWLVCGFALYKPGSKQNKSYEQGFILKDPSLERLRSKGIIHAMVYYYKVD